MQKSALKYLHNLLVILSAIVLFAACDTFIDVEIPERESKLVVISAFEPDEPWQVYVSHSLNSFEDDNFFPVSNAEVTIASDDGNFSEQLYYNSGIFYSSSTPEEGTNYTISVKANGYTSVQSANRIPSPATLISIDTLESFHDGNPTFDFELTFQDPANEANFYILQLYSAETYWKNYSDYPINILSDDPNIESILNKEDSDILLFLKDQNFDGKEYTVRFYMPDYFYYPELKGVQFKVKLISCSEEYFRFQKTARQYQYSNDNPFSQPVQIYSNIENGIGIFGGFVESGIEL